MDKRVVLARMIRVMLTVLVLAFVFVLFRSLSGPPLTSNSNNAFDNVVIGQTALRRVSNQRVWVTRLSKAQIRQADELGKFVVDATQGCNPANALCVIDARSQRSGIDLVYLRNTPEQLPRESAWYGGFIDPVSGAVFDFMGRAYKGVRSDDDRVSIELVGY